MAIEVDGGWENLPFDEAIAWFRRKVSIPTERWNDLTSEAHERAFTVAGATSIQVLSALRAAVDKSLANGTSLQEFRKDFDRIVAETGWSYRGNRTWRTELILNQNIRNAYGRGRFLQLTDPDTMKARPIWRWRHGDSIQPRPLHLGWDGVTLPAGHPWFMARIPPAGFGCKCKIISLSRGAKLTPPPKETYETYTYPNGVTVKLPAGVDPGFEHVPDRDNLEKEVLKSLRKLNVEEQQSAFERLGLVNSPRYVPEEITDSFMRKAIGAVLNSNETRTTPEALARRLQENKAFNIGQAVVTQWGLEDMGPVWEYAQLVVSGGLVTEVSKSIQKEFQKTVARHMIDVFGEGVIKDMRSRIEKPQKVKQRTYCFSGLPSGSGLGAEEIVEKLKDFGLDGEVLAFSTTGGLGKNFSGGGVLRALFKMNYFIQAAAHNIIADWLEFGPVDKLNLVGYSLGSGIAEGVAGVLKELGVVIDDLVVWGGVGAPQQDISRRHRRYFSDKDVLQLVRVRAPSKWDRFFRGVFHGGFGEFLGSTWPGREDVLRATVGDLNEFLTRGGTAPPQRDPTRDIPLITNEVGAYDHKFFESPPAPSEVAGAIRNIKRTRRSSLMIGDLDLLNGRAVDICRLTPLNVRQVASIKKFLAGGGVVESFDDLYKIPNIGPRTVEKLKELAQAAAESNIPLDINRASIEEIVKVLGVPRGVAESIFNESSRQAFVNAADVRRRVRGVGSGIEKKLNNLCVFQRRSNVSIEELARSMKNLPDFSLPPDDIYFGHDESDDKSPDTTGESEGGPDSSRGGSPETGGGMLPTTARPLGPTLGTPEKLVQNAVPPEVRQDP